MSIGLTIPQNQEENGNNDEATIQNATTIDATKCPESKICKMSIHEHDENSNVTKKVDVCFLFLSGMIGNAK